MLQKRNRAPAGVRTHPFLLGRWPGGPFPSLAVPALCTAALKLGEGNSVCSAATGGGGTDCALSVSVRPAEQYPAPSSTAALARDAITSFWFSFQYVPFVFPG